MFPILEARFLAPDVKLFRIEAPRIARKRQAGQFVILRVHDHGERIPLTIADSDAERGDDHDHRPGHRQDDQAAELARGRRRHPRRRRPAGQAVRGRALRHRLRDRRRRRRGDRLPDGGGAEAGRQPRDLDPRRPHPRAGHPRGRDPRDERRALRHHRRRQLRREGPRHRPAEGADRRPASASTTSWPSARSR